MALIPFRKSHLEVEEASSGESALDLEERSSFPESTSAREPVSGARKRDESRCTKGDFEASYTEWSLERVSEPYALRGSIGSAPCTPSGERESRGAYTYDVGEVYETFLWRLSTIHDKNFDSDNDLRSRSVERMFVVPQ